MRKRYNVTSCIRTHRFTDVGNEMDEKDGTRRYGARFKNERVKSRNLSEKKRRDQFNMLINELCTMVSSSSRKMDKSSVLRSTISFLRNHRELSVQQQSVEIQENWKPSFLSNEEFTHLMLEALGGFIMVFSCTGQILYTSESVTSLLGYLPSDICSSVFDMIHECDRPSLYTLINSPTENVLSITVHMKHGPIYSQENASYELVRLMGSFHHWPSSSSSPVEGSSTCNIECDSNSCSSICSPLSSATVEWPLCFVAMAKLQTPKLLRIVNFSDEPKNEFTSRHSLEWTFLFLDHRAPPIIGYLPFEVLGTSGYDYYHVDDLDNIASCHETLMQTGEGTSCYYRFLTKGQQWVWLQTRSFISYHQWSSKPEFIVCKNVIVSNEVVEKSIRKSLKKPIALARKSSFSSQTFPTHNQSACLSPTLSASSLGSLSSEHSGRHSVATPFKSNSSFFANHVNEDMPNTQVPKEDSNPQCNVELNTPTFLTDQTQFIPISPSESTIANHPFIERQEATTSRCTTPASTFDTAVQSPFWRTQVLTPVTASSNLSLQCQTTSSNQPPIVIETSQAQLQDYLRRRHQAIQQQILLQQEELRRVAEQLMLVQFGESNTISQSDMLLQTPLIATESLSSVFRAGNSSQSPPSSTANSGFLGQLSRLPEAASNSLNSFANSQPGVRLIYSSQDPNMSLSQESNVASSSRQYMSSHRNI